MKRCIVVILIFFLLAIEWGTPRPAAAEPQAPWPQTTPQATAPTKKPSAVRGRGLYAQNCVACHGQTGKGDGQAMTAQGQKAADFTDPNYIRQNSPADLFNVVTNGRMDKLMPPWKNRLTPDQIWDSVFYTWSLGTPQENVAAGKTLYQDKCTACHGAGGAGDGPQASSLATKPKNLADLNFMANLSQSDLLKAADETPEHSSWKALSEIQRWQALDYVRTFSYEAPAPETSDGVIEGKVQAGTKDAQLDLSQVQEVTLLSFTGEQDNPPVTAKIAPDGTFRFDKLLTGGNHQYFVKVTYRGVDYVSKDTLVFSVDKQKLSVTIPVYETTTKRDTIRVQRTHFILDFPADKTIRVGELYIFDNTGDRAYVGEPGADGKPVTLKFTLPAGATGLEFQDTRMEESTTKTSDGFTDSLAIPPGQRQVFFSYQLTFNPPNYKFVRKLDYSTVNANALVSDIGQQANATALTPREPLQGGSGLKFFNFVGSNLAAGQEITIELTNLPQRIAPQGGESGVAAASRAATAGTTQDLAKWFGVGLAILVVGAAVGYPLLKGRRISVPARAPRGPRPPARYEPEPAVDLETRRRQLLTAIARLDDRFEAGDLAEDAYQSQRAALKAQLVEVIRQIRAGASSS